MQAILNKCTKEDFNFLSEILDSYFSFTDDKKRKELLKNSMHNSNARNELIELIDRQIKYYGSSDIAYLKRFLFTGNGGVEAKEIVEDVCAKFNIKIKFGGSTEALLERLTKAVVEKEFLSKSPEELANEFRKMGISNVDINKILEYLKNNGKVAVLPILLQILGPKVTLGIIETIVISLIAAIIGREAAKQIVKELVKRNPWLNALGPVVWALSGTWLAFDLQGPAYRKTIPICLYLGIVALRDGDEDLKEA